MEEHFPDAVQIVARYHVVEHIWEGTHAVDGERGYSAEASADKPLTALREGDLETVISSFRAHVNPVQGMNKSRKPSPVSRTTGFAHARTRVHCLGITG